MLTGFKILADGTNLPIVDGREIAIALSDEQRGEVLRTHEFQPREWDGKSNPCKREGRAGRNIICHVTCPAYLAYRAATDASNAARILGQEATHVTMKRVGEKARLARSLNRDAKITRSV